METFPRYWSFVRGIHQSPMNSPHKGQWRGALMFSLIYARINSSVNNRQAGDLRRHRSHYNVTVLVSMVVADDSREDQNDRKFIKITLDISGSPIEFQWGSRKYPG